MQPIARFFALAGLLWLVFATPQFGSDGRTSKFVAHLLEDGWSFSIRVPGMLQVAVEEGTEAQFLLLTPEQAAHIALELAIMGHEDRLATVLTTASVGAGQLRDTGSGSYTLNLRIARPTTRRNWFQHDVPGRPNPAVDTARPLPSAISIQVSGNPRLAYLQRDPHQRFLVFTTTQAEEIEVSLRDVGLSTPEVAMALVGFRSPLQPTRPNNGTLLANPPCSECTLGSDCDPKSLECCEGIDLNCVVCNFCATEFRVTLTLGPRVLQ